MYHYFALGILSLLFLLTVVTLRHTLRMRNKKSTALPILQQPLQSLRSCLLCGRDMQPGEKMISKMLKRKDDSIIYMYGCSTCAHTAIQRTCPVCKRKMPNTGYLIGRMWMRKKTGKKHLHVAGCERCARIRTGNTEM